MSGRIRTVKPEWLEDERMAAATDAARLLSIGLILLADDHGNGRAHLLFLASHIWPYANDSQETLRRADGALRELATIGFIQLYEVGKQQYYSIRNWKKHQRVQHPSMPRVPGPANADTPSSAAPQEPRPPDLTPPSGGPHEGLTPDLRSPIPITDPDPDPDPRAHARARANGSTQPQGDELLDDQVVVRAFTELRQRRKKPWHRGVKDFTALQDATETLRLAADASGRPLATIAAESLAGFERDEWARKAGYPFSAWAQDPGKYLGADDDQGAVDPITAEFQRLQKRCETCSEDERPELERRLNELGEQARRAKRSREVAQ